MTSRRGLIAGLGATLIVGAPAIVAVTNLMKLPRRPWFVPRPGQSYVEISHQGRTLVRAPFALPQPQLNWFGFDGHTDRWGDSWQVGHVYQDGYLHAASVAVADTTLNNWVRIEFDPVLVHKGEEVRLDYRVAT